MPRGPVRSYAQLRSELAGLISKNGGTSLSINEYNRLARGKDLASVSTYRTKFGSWENAVRAALLILQPPTEHPADQPGETEYPVKPAAEQPAVKPPARPSPPTRAVTWKETPKEEREKQLAEQRAQAEADGTSREVKLVNLFGAKVIFGREATSSSTKSLESSGEARICAHDLRPIREGVDDTCGLSSLVGGTLLRRHRIDAKILRGGQLVDFPPERPRTFYLVPETVATALLSTGRKDIVYPHTYGSGNDGTIICREIVIP